MAQNPTRIEEWLTQLGTLKDKDREALLFAAHFSGTPQAQAYLSRQPEADKYRDVLRDIRTLEPNDPTILDMLWADFFATGEIHPIRRIVMALNHDKYSGALKQYEKSEKTEKDRNDALLETVFQAAMWSLESNAQQHRRVGEMLEQIYFTDKLTQPEQIWLSTLLAKVMPEKYEFTRSDAGQWIFKRKAAAQETAGWRDRDGKALAETVSMKSKDGFAGSLLATTDENWQEKWNTPEDTAPNFNQAGVVPYGKKVNILTFFSNPKLDQHGKANVRCDFRLLTPGNRVALEHKDVNCFAGTLQGNAYALRLSAPVISFYGDRDDPPGIWSVEVQLRDIERNVELALRTTFELK